MKSKEKDRRMLNMPTVFVFLMRFDSFDAYRVRDGAE